MQIITTAIIKGGAGKTTTNAAIAQAAAADEKRVLAIDLDPQSNLSIILGADPNAPGSYDLLHGADPAKLIQQTAQGIAVIPASPNLATERTTPGSVLRLRDALAPIREDFDLIVIDTPPQMGELTYNALQASTGLLIPLEADNGSIQGLYQIADIAHQMQQHNPALTIYGTVITRYDKRPNLRRYLREVIEQTGEELGAPLLTEIRPGIAIQEAQSMQVSLFEYAPKSKPAEDYRRLYDLIKDR